jgi:S1-C subfamily serine protease
MQPDEGGWPPARNSLSLERTLSLQEARFRNPNLPTDVVVKIHGTGVRPSYLLPWQVQAQHMWTGTGFVIEGRRIMTNAHVVMDATVLQVTKQDDPTKFYARLVCIAHDLDLALLSVDDESFWQKLPAAEFASNIPELYSEVKAVGFPTGGSTVCVTKGILSRIDAQVYVHPQCLGVGIANNNDRVTILQIDAAINPGNSGGPAFDIQGKVVGIASSGMPDQQNIGYVIPFFIAKMFLHEVISTGSWSGISEVGVKYASLENDSMRSFLDMGSHRGVLVTKIAPLGVLYGKLQEGDVITHVDGYDVTNDGDIPFSLGEQTIHMDMESVHTQKVKGAITTFGILRHGQAMQVAAALHPIPPLTPRFHGYDVEPEFLMIGGIVFTRGSVPLFKEGRQKRQLARIWTHFDDFKEDSEHELVVVLTILTHEVNSGYDMYGIVESFNETKIRSLAQLAHHYGMVMRQPESTSGANRFLRFCIGSKDKDKDKLRRPDIVLDRLKVTAADKEICSVNRIPSIASPQMMRHVNGEVVTPVVRNAYLPSVPQSRQSRMGSTDGIKGQILAGLPSLQVGATGNVGREELVQLLMHIRANGTSFNRDDVENFIGCAFPAGECSVPYSRFIDFVFNL